MPDQLPPLAPHQLGGYVCSDDPGEKGGAKRVSIDDTEGELLAFLAGDKIVLEIGTGLGVSTRYLASTANTVTTIDIDPWVQTRIWPTLPPNVRPVREISGGPYDMVFIDAEHTPGAVADDMNAALEACNVGVIVAHDTNAAAVRDTLENFPLLWTFLPTVHGLGICWVGWC